MPSHRIGINRDEIYPVTGSKKISMTGSSVSMYVSMKLKNGCAWVSEVVDIRRKMVSLIRIRLQSVGSMHPNYHASGCEPGGWVCASGSVGSCRFGGTSVAWHNKKGIF